MRRACGDAFDIVDITTDTELEQRYRTRIPLVTVDGVERFRYEVDEGALRELVTAALLAEIGEAELRPHGYSPRVVVASATRCTAMP